MRVFPNGSGLLLGLLMTFLLAWFLPWRQSGDTLALSDWISKGCIFIIFLIQGWNVKFFRLVGIFTNFRTLIRVHMLILLGPFLVVLLAVELNWIPFEWQAGFIFLSILPTTISTCVVYTLLAGGDSDVALGHATLSNLLAIVWVPLIWLIYYKERGGMLGIYSIEAGREIIPKIALLIMLPIFLGWWVKNTFFNNQIPRLDNYLKQASFAGILILVYFAFSKNINEIGHDALILLILGMFPYLLFFLICHQLISWIGVFLGKQKKGQKIAEFYCISQKSMVMGLPLIMLLRGGELKNGLLLTCPLILYHFLQLSFGVCLVARFKKWINGKT